MNRAHDGRPYWVGVATFAALFCAWYLLTTVTQTIGAGRFPSPSEAWDALRQITIVGYADARLPTHVLQSAKLVLYDGRADSPTKGELQEVFLGEDNYVLVQIPPGITNGYKAYGDKMVVLANCASEPHRPDEIVRFDPFSKEIPYDWNLKHG